MTEIKPKSTNDLRETAAALASHILGTCARKAQPATPAVDPNADPLSTLTQAERDEMEANPELKLRERFLAQVEAAEAVGREQRERAENLETSWKGHAARDAVDDLARRAVELRAKARNGQ